MWWVIPFSAGIGVSTGIGVGLRGGSLKEVLAWSALTAGVSGVVTSKWFWRGAWGGARWVAPYIASGSVAVAGDIGIMGKAFTTTRTAAALGSGVTLAATVGVGATVGAVTGTLIVQEAEERGLVYEGATADVLDFYTGQAEGQYWGDYTVLGTPKSSEAGMPGYFNIPGNVRYIVGHYW